MTRLVIGHVLKNKSTYGDLSADHLPKRDPERAMRRMRCEANSLGLTIRFDHPRAPIERRGVKVVVARMHA